MIKKLPVIPILRKLAALPALFLVLVVMSISTGFLPQLMDQFGVIMVEFSDGEESDTQNEDKEKKDKEAKEFVKNCNRYLRHQLAMAHLQNKTLAKWCHHFGETPTPPPELI